MKKARVRNCVSGSTIDKRREVAPPVLEVQQDAKQGKDNDKNDTKGKRKGFTMGKAQRSSLRTIRAVSVTF